MTLVKSLIETIEFKGMLSPYHLLSLDVNTALFQRKTDSCK